MNTIQEKYNGILQGNYLKSQFLHEAFLKFPKFLTRTNTFDDVVRILKNKGILTENTHTHNHPLEAVDRGIRFEFEKKGKTTPDDVSKEDLDKVTKQVIRNLDKNPLYYLEKLDKSEKKESTGGMKKVGKINEMFDDYEEPAGSDPIRKKRLKHGIVAKSALERISQEVWQEPSVEKGKQILLNFIKSTRIQPEVQTQMVQNISKINNKRALDFYVANSLLKFEKMQVREVSNVPPQILEEVVRTLVLKTFKK